MTLKVGRVEFGADGQSTVGTLSFAGGVLTVAGDILAADQAAVSAQIQRTLGLIEARDEPVVPVLWPDGPPDVEGFYRVSGGQVDAARGRTPAGAASFSLQLTRVSGFAAPMFEDRVISGLRKGVSGVILSAVAYPSTVRGFEIGADLTPSTRTRSSVDGDMVVMTSTTTVLNNTTTRFFLEPEDWYVGAATLEVGGELAIGRQVRNTPTDWELTNGILRIRPENLTGYGSPDDPLPYESQQLVVDFWDGSGWSASDRVAVLPARLLVPGGPTPLGIPHTITVTKNAPEAVTIRLTYDAASAVAGSRFSVNLDITLRRGALMAEFYMSSRGGYRWGAVVGSWGSLSSIGGGGARYTSAGQMVAYQAGATLGDPGTTYSFRSELFLDANAQTIAFGVGNTGGEVAAEVAYMWRAATTESVNAVVR